MYGRSVMAETIEATVRDANAKIVSDHNLRLAMEPKVTLPTEEDAIKAVVDGKADLAYSVAMEILPKIELADFKDIKLERLVADVTDAEIDEAVETHRRAEPAVRCQGRGRASGRAATRSRSRSPARIDGEPFEGGTGEDVAVVIGSKSFIPGFEEQLDRHQGGREPHRQGDVSRRTICKAELAGKEAAFEVDGEVDRRARRRSTIDDAFAKPLGIESLAKLRDAVKRPHRARARGGDARSSSSASCSMRSTSATSSSCRRPWSSRSSTTSGRPVADDLKSQGRTLRRRGDDRGGGARPSTARSPSGACASAWCSPRSASKNDIKVTDEEVQRAIVERARQFPGQEQQVWDYYRKNPQALASLRAPIYEEKVVDFLLELAKVTEKKVTREELYKDEDETAWRSGGLTRACALAIADAPIARHGGAASGGAR